MDADITAAVTALDLEKIRVQDNRVFRAQQLAVLQAQQAWIQTAYSMIPLDDTPADIRRQLTIELAAKYMTTSTAVDPVLVLADAQKDAARLKAAVDEALKVL